MFKDIRVFIRCYFRRRKVKVKNSGPPRHGGLWFSAGAAKNPQKPAPAAKNQL
jgi:hypothetical protein